MDVFNNTNVEEDYEPIKQYAQPQHCCEGRYAFLMPLFLIFKQKHLSYANCKSLFHDHIKYKEFLNAFFARFRNSSGAAEQIVNNVVDEHAPDRLSDLIAALEELYLNCIGAEGVRDCGVAISCAFQLKAMGASAFVPLVEIHEAVVLNDPDS